MKHFIWLLFALGFIPLQSMEVGLKKSAIIHPAPQRSPSIALLEEQTASLKPAPEQDSEKGQSNSQSLRTLTFSMQLKRNSIYETINIDEGEPLHALKEKTWKQLIERQTVVKRLPYLIVRVKTQAGIHYYDAKRYQKKLFCGSLVPRGSFIDLLNDPITKRPLSGPITYFMIQAPNENFEQCGTSNHLILRTDNDLLLNLLHSCCSSKKPEAAFTRGMARMHLGMLYFKNQKYTLAKTFLNKMLQDQEFICLPKTVQEMIAASQSTVQDCNVLLGSPKEAPESLHVRLGIIHKEPAPTFLSILQKEIATKQTTLICMLKDKIKLDPEEVDTLIAKKLVFQNEVDFYGNGFRVEHTKKIEDIKLNAVQQYLQRARPKWLTDPDFKHTSYQVLHSRLTLSRAQLLDFVNQGIVAEHTCNELANLWKQVGDIFASENKFQIAASSYDSALKFALDDTYIIELKTKKEDIKKQEKKAHQSRLAHKKIAAEIIEKQKKEVAI